MSDLLEAEQVINWVSQEEESPLEGRFTYLEILPGDTVFFLFKGKIQEGEVEAVSLDIGDDMKVKNLGKKYLA